METKVPSLLLSQNESKLEFSKGENVISAIYSVPVIKPIPDPPVQTPVERTVVARGTRTPSPNYAINEGFEVIGYSNEQCITYAKKKAGIERPLGYAGRVVTQEITPKVGVIGLMSNYGHAVFVEAVDDNRIQVSEANWVKGEIIRRWLNLDEMRGYVYQ
jgi:hypothetical protein